MADDGGLSRLQRRLAAIPEAAKAAVRPSMEKNAQRIVDLARSLCPVDEGELRDSIDWTWGRAPSGSMSLAVERGYDMVITVYAGSDKVFYARWVEFGTQEGTKRGRVPDNRKVGGGSRKSYRSHPGTPAQPFFYPAFRLSRKRSASAIRAAIRRAIKKHGGAL